MLNAFDQLSSDLNINFDVYGNKIYMQKIINIKDKEVAEFNYK